METAVIVRPERRDKYGNKQRKLCKFCSHSGRAMNPDGTNLVLVCCTKSWRKNEVVVLGSDSLALSCYEERPFKSKIVHYRSFKEFLDFPNMKLDDFLLKPEKNYVYQGRLPDDFF
jgi:hypothetical protein